MKTLRKLSNAQLRMLEDRIESRKGRWCNKLIHRLILERLRRAGL